MQTLKSSIRTLIIAISTVQLANGFFTTFISLRVTREVFGEPYEGLVLSAYFIGYSIGAARCGKIIERIGHIRAFAAFGGLIAAATSFMPILLAPLPWILLRLCVGFGCAGLFITTESWLNVKAEPSERSRIFAVYMVGTLSARGFGQLLIGSADVMSFSPFNLIAALFAAALLMVSMTRSEQPPITRTIHLPFAVLYKKAPVAVWACIVSGFISGAFFALVPAWMQGEGLNQSNIAFFMFITIMGSLLFQVPVGRFSDNFDRHLVLGLLSMGFALVALAIVLLPVTRQILFPFAFTMGGFMASIYPVSIAQAHEQMEAEEIVAVSGWMILGNGIGASIGPMLGSVVMRGYDIDGLFYLMAFAAAVVAIAGGVRWMRAPETPREPRRFDVLTPQTSPLSHSYKETEVDDEGDESQRGKETS